MEENNSSSSSSFPEPPSALNEQNKDYVKIMHMDKLIKIAEMTKAVNLPTKKMLQLAQMPWQALKDPASTATSGEENEEEDPWLRDKMKTSELVTEIELDLETCKDRLERVGKDVRTFKQDIRGKDVDPVFFEKISTFDQSYLQTRNLTDAFLDICSLVKQILHGTSDAKGTVEQILAKLQHLKWT